MEIDGIEPNNGNEPTNASRMKDKEDYPPPRMQNRENTQSVWCESSINSSEGVCTPQVQTKLVPFLKQEFDNLDAALLFYNNYAKESGFSTRNHSSRKNRNGVIVRKEFVCSKQGVPSMPKQPEANKRRRGTTREGCGARLAVVKSRSGENYIVSQFVEGHNHPFTTPRRVHLLRSHRNVTTVKKTLADQLAAANVPTCQQMNDLELQSGCLQNVEFLRQNLYNVEKDSRKMLAEQDAEMLYEHFEIEQQKNPNFTFAIKKDEEGRMTHCFWADATCRQSYKYFGDVVVFDTTHNTNRYSMIFAHILGVNHHRQTTLFGCAFLSDETSNSFEWLFKEWLKAMPAGPPKMIITDQDPAMTKTFAIVLPNTYHMYCIRHIVNKFSKKISALSYKKHYEKFKNCIWNSESPEEFEASWLDVVEKANLSNNEWLDAMYKIRDQWIPAYTKRFFSACMTSTQKAEISPSFFKKYVSSTNSLWDFVTRFDRALSQIRHNELRLDHIDVYEKPPLKTAFDMEETMSEVYTRTIFFKFQEELFQCTGYRVMMSVEDEHHLKYNVKRTKAIDSRVYEVLVEKSSNKIACSCKMFECEGIPCRHMLIYFYRMGILELPDQYILQRWTKSAKAMRVANDLGEAVSFF